MCGKESQQMEVGSIRWKDYRWQLVGELHEEAHVVTIKEFCDGLSIPEKHLEKTHSKC